MGEGTDWDYLYEGEEKLIGVDLDGVIGEWDAAAVATLKERGGYPDLVYPSADWDYIQRNVSKSDWHWLWSHKGGLYPMFSRVQPYPGAVSAMERLSTMGRVQVVTKRPEGVEELTWWWLTAWEIPFERLIMVGDLKSSHGSWDYFVDDKPENVEDLSKGGKVFLLRRMWNRDFVWPHTIYNLHEFADAIQEEK